MNSPAFVRPSLLPRPPPPPVLEPVDLDTWDDGDFWGDEFYSESEPDFIDQPWPYRFKSGDGVHICASDGHWYYGKVVGQPKCGRMKYEREYALYWRAEFQFANCKIRKWFAPLNGDIKPDNKNTEELLWRASLVFLD